MAALLTQLLCCLKKKIKKLKLKKNEETRTIFLLSIRTKYTRENIISMLKKIKAYIRLLTIFPSCQINNSFRKYQKIIANKKINNEKINDFIIFFLLLICIKNI